MSPRPYVLASAACSVDGYLDDASGQRLLLSGAADLDRVDEVRAGVDAILVGANTIRRDDPRLLVRSERRRAERVRRGLPPSPVRVTMTASGELDPTARFFTVGDAARLVYVPSGEAEAVTARMGSAASVIDAGDPLDLDVLLADLAARGVRRLMVEGGGRVHTAFLAAGLVDELHLVIAPFLVGDAAAPRFVGPAAFPQDAANRMTLVETRAVGDCALLRYRIDGAERG
ncbi:5-amino-6-(5-phosphoribosylamino)uracil reductase [Actinoalloteichus hoggarensis]|uniref:2,5-diamino-6-ribosylamino-4(3H)-pyrimidinone 5'-phosphate reductase n=1 Tax=Actinoalloteichus hoggarensis TaxID=1470176 RepID=A0A221W1E8_9PSEU|nr:RibD family protein [Actinoalloteichus hoggarensis]ASO19604.1 2,5-diamino-6-ribosylamino-4(3H)-pyrimidinone 5'-phosphate reductase [Actinoalloteichus hoggarensis]MBB5919689.1 5-amino-6-(5-phosphoribosylamino)uracil reductase [Actinoalloteichus hoggarensis]